MGSKRIIVAGTGSGAGKTTVTIGLMAAFRKKAWSYKDLSADQIILTQHITQPLPAVPRAIWIAGCLRRMLYVACCPAQVPMRIFL